MRLEYKTALRLLKDNNFIETHRRGSHIKFKRGNQVVMVTEGGWQHTNQCHSKQSKEILEAIKGNNTAKTEEEHGR